MDRSTLAVYDQDAAAFAEEWHTQPTPVDLQGIVARFFVEGGSTADIGCGSGREVAWLNANGFPAVGFDASEGLLAEARRRYPKLQFASAELPDLQDIAAGSYDNLLCETVIMHLDHALIAPSVRRMLDIVRPAGIFYLSWRVTEGADVRDPNGRLYAAFDTSLVRAELMAAKSLLDEACGQLSVSCHGEPGKISVCHCIECQKRTGSPYGVAAFFHRGDVEPSGQARQFTWASDSPGACLNGSP